MIVVEQRVWYSPEGVPTYVGGSLLYILHLRTAIGRMPRQPEKANISRTRISHEDSSFQSHCVAKSFGNIRGHCVRGRMVVGFATTCTYVISVYHH
jgi:hypothetical protein